MTDHMKDADKARHSSSMRVERSGRSSNDGGASLGKLLGWGAVAAVGLVIVRQWPEVQRYLKMRQM